jgi:diguanylate cyclase (GGDEF)-like protein
VILLISSLHTFRNGPNLTSSEQLSREHLELFQVFRNVSMEPIWELLRLCELRKLDAGEVLLRKDQSNRSMFLILDGSLKVYLDDDHQTVAAELGQGQTVGELSVIDGSAASAHVLSASETLLLCVDENTFWRITRASHGFCTNLLMLLSLRMRSSNASLVESENLQWKFEQQSLTDGLTGIYNRRWLDQMLPRLLHRCEQDNQPFIDIDHFKNFNDTYGHSVGDDVLCVVASTLANKIRPIDVAARYGGEEFCVLLPETNLKDGINTGKRLCKAVQETRIDDSNGKPVPGITISAGLAERKAGESADESLKRADLALYTAKANGRDRMEISN